MTILKGNGTKKKERDKTFPTKPFQSHMKKFPIYLITILKRREQSKIKEIYAKSTILHKKKMKI